MKNLSAYLALASVTATEPYPNFNNMTLSADMLNFGLTMGINHLDAWDYSGDSATESFYAYLNTINIEVGQCRKDLGISGNGETIAYADLSA